MKLSSCFFFRFYFANKEITDLNNKIIKQQKALEHLKKNVNNVSEMLNIK